MLTKILGGNYYSRDNLKNSALSVYLVAWLSC